MAGSGSQAGQVVSGTPATTVSQGAGASNAAGAPATATVTISQGAGEAFELRSAIVECLSTILTSLLLFI